VVETRRANHRRVFIWFASWWRNHQLKQAEKPHSKSRGRKALDGPATRPKTPLAVENGVGKLTAPERGAPNVGMGKRAWRTPIPHLSLLDRKAGQGLIVFGGEKTSNIEHRTSNMEHGIENKSLKLHLIGCSEFDVDCSMLQTTGDLLLLGTVLVPPSYFRRGSERT
jgi:hypothetical protein